jgi:RNA polymerase sigma-70 factor (ECF subfamily)
MRDDSPSTAAPPVTRYDGLSFEAVVARYAAPLHRFFRRRLRDLHQVENLVQETFLRAFRYAGSYGHGQRLSGWMYAIAANLLKDLVSREARGPDLVELGRGAAEFPARDRLSCPDAVAQDRELEKALLMVLLELTARHRTVFVLKHHYGLTYAQVGQVLRISEGTAKSRMHKATRLVARKLARRGFLRAPAKADR